MQATGTDIEVLIVGAGPVGLAAAIELGRRGINCLVVERNDRVGYAPRAKTTNVRTREHLRRWGIADRLREVSPMPRDYPSTVIFATRMTGPPLARFENALNGNLARNDLYSEAAQWVPQYVLEEVLREHAASLPGVSVRFGLELAGFVQDEDGVVGELRVLSTGATERVRSAFLIGADGARSVVRDAIGATMLGDRAYSRNSNVIFRAPELASRHQHGRAIMYWLVNQDLPCVLGPMDGEGLWFFMATKLADETDPERVDPAVLIRRGTGLHDLDIEILSQDVWAAHKLVADRYAKGRVFLAGDACHLHPPFGGFGMNMGIGDAVDLGWKLAAVLRGWGGGKLLASYEAERRNVHERTIAEAVINHGMVGNQLVRPGLEDPGPLGEATRREVSEIIEAGKLREFRTLGIVLGSRYADSPIIVPDGSAPPEQHVVLYVPSAHPGCLAPHLWLADGSSLYDHFGQGFTLLLTEGERSQAEDFAAEAASLRIPLTVVAPEDRRLPARYGARFALIRPDQHVAWRGDILPEDATSMLARVTGATASSETSA
ncbi:FAD-dependent oxidoreductase [Chelatococcus asaccharovorans]|uniref:2-polyprenyl-6-methoxyphenol hydroxylase-like FAD-dependent oxidoreductase n=1 Tax=Chelatococcus asaccharovorans TaxID=28210 RepID=A0A2V3U155_9HYPH|nr:FAD-dependent oxidoreductase [Chelatococcus asaccharovorans]MBS7707762.1 FAD-dependent monooxygenase [Chelatococcus asaccharovorans]PXW55339.1 2-polyprenyl-6-methoxyphenol hydroxylase-like FAD-dependent oxidoreductase [Chelatococcus asaccharovorans]